MNKIQIIFMIIGIIIGISSTILIRPNFWKNRKQINDANIIITFLLHFCITIVFLEAFMGGFFDSELVFFSPFMIVAIILLLVNLILANHVLTGNITVTLKRKNFLISCCILIIFSILTIILKVQFAKVAVPTNKVLDKSLESILLDDKISIKRKDLLKVTKTDLSSSYSYSSNGRIIYWINNTERNKDCCIIFHNNICFVKEYKNNSTPSLFPNSYKEIGFVINDDNKLYRAYAIIKYKDFKFYVDHYVLYDYEDNQFVQYDSLPTWATNK